MCWAPLQTGEEDGVGRRLAGLGAEFGDARVLDADLVEEGQVGVRLVRRTLDARLRFVQDLHVPRWLVHGPFHDIGSPIATNEWDGADRQTDRQREDGLTFSFICGMRTSRVARAASALAAFLLEPTPVPYCMALISTVALYGVAAFSANRNNG